MNKVAGVRSVAAVVALCLVSFAVTASAQGGMLITGKVTNDKGVPLSNANVFVTTLNIGAYTNANGAYTLTVPVRANGQQVVLASRFIGYVRQNRTITLTAGNQTQDFTLRADPFRLDEVVVTGVANATSSRNIPFSISKVTEDQLKEVPATSPIAALAGKVAGAKISLSTGNPGAAPIIRLRGSTNLGVGGSSPLIILDGVITKYTIADIDANDIESIEVLKGAAAASFYGSDAANGVVNIATKRGRELADNKLNFQTRSEYGKSGIEHFVPLNHSTPYTLNADGTIKLTNGARSLDADQIADNPYPTTGPEAWRDQLQTWLGDGKFYSTNFQMGLRRGNTNFNSSFTNDHNTGVLPMTNGQFRQNARMNVDQAVTDKMDLSAGITYGINKNDYDPTSSDGFFGLLQAPPDVDLRNPSGQDSVLFNPKIPDAKSPNARANPLYQYANEEVSQRAERIIGAFSARWRPTSWLRFEGSYGTDRRNNRNTLYQRRGYLGEQGQATNGRYNVSGATNVAENTQLNSTLTKLLFNGGLLSTTRLAYLVETTDFNSQNANGSKLNVTDVPDLAALDPTQVSLGSSYTSQRTIDYQASQNFTIKDRYIIDAQVRRDGSSLFGPEARYQNFYRVAGAYRISEDLHIPAVQEWKLRAGRGTAGLRPSFDAQFETYTITGGQISKFQLGNKALKPAIQTETELGTNLTVLDRFDMELTYADRITKGAFIKVPLSLAASGGFQNQIQNAGDVGSKTTEFSLQTRVIDMPNFSYSFGITGDHTTQRILKLGRAPFRVNENFGQNQDVFYYKEGESLGIMYGTHWVRSFAELKQNPANASAVESNYVINPLGYLVPVAQRGTPAERAIAFVDATGQNQFKIGDVNPDFNFGFSNNIKIKGFGIYALFDGQKGGQIYNFTKQWMFQDFRHAAEDQSNVPAAEKIALPFFSSGMYNGLVASDFFVESGSYVKLRELSVSYDLGARQLDRVGLSRYANNVKVALIGRNVKTWTNYTGFDPEVTAGSDFNFKVDGFRYPQFRTITGQVSIGF